MTCSSKFGIIKTNYSLHTSSQICYKIFKISLNKDKIRNDILRDVEHLVRGMARLSKVSPLLGIPQEAVLHLLEDVQILPIKTVRTSLKINADNMSHVLRSLENYQKGEKIVSLVGRKTDIHDIRCKSIFITEYGKKILAENSKRREQRLGILFRRLNEKELKTFSKFIKKMIEGINFGAKKDVRI